MFLELALLSLLIPSSGKPDREYALLLEEAEKKGWRVVRCSIRNFKSLFLPKSVYRVTFSEGDLEKDFVVSIQDGNQYLFGLLQAGHIETAKALLNEAKIK